MEFGPFLRKLRLDVDLTQRELAGRAAMNFAYLSKIEAGLVAPPSEEKLVALANALNLKDANRNTFFALAEQARVPKAVVKDALIRHPELGALLRRVNARPLSQDELKIVRRLAEQGDTKREEPTELDDSPGT